MRGYFIICLLLLAACSTPNNDRIVVPKLHAGFYAEALDRIDKELKSSPDDERLIDQKLFYCEELDWPQTCIDALNAYREIHGMTNQLVEQYIIYYSQHEEYQLLIDVIDRWANEYDLGDQFTETYIDALTRLERKATATLELKQYLKNNQSLEALTFASTQYLRIKDTTMAAYNLSKVYEQDKSSNLMWEYGSILVTLGYDDRGFEVMDQYVKARPEDYDVQLTYARLLQSTERKALARKVIQPFKSKDTVAYLLADWYQKDYLWDSASYTLSEIVARDSTSRKPIWKLGRLYEDRGWFLASIPYFEHLIEMNANDTLAQQRIDLIQRKIAYLQRLKFEENKIPTIELQPKTIEN